MHSIEQVTPARATELLPQLCDLLIDSVQSGASVGFLPPLSRERAEAYWRSVIDQLETPHHVLIVALVHTVLVGSVQLHLAEKPNARHRAEVQKLMVHSRFRRHGFARALMHTAESTTRALHRTL